MPTVKDILGHTQNLIKRAIELVRDSEELVQDTKATRRRLNRSRHLCRESLRSLKAGMGPSSYILSHGDFRYSDTR